MFRLALRSTLAKKRRLAGTALSVLIGIAFLSGTLVFTDTIQRTFDDLFASIYENTDSYVRASGKLTSDQGLTERPRISDSMIAKVGRVRGVAAADGLLTGYAQIIGADGDAIGNPSSGAPTFAMTYAQRGLTPWELTEGSQPPGPGEVVVDKHSADVGGLEIGDEVTVVTQNGPHTFRLVGLARFGSVDSPGGASVSVLDLRTAQQVLLGGARQVDAVVVEAEDGVSEDVLTARIRATLPAGMEALTGAQVTKESQDLMRKGLSFLDTFLIVFAAIALVVASFTIYNTFQIIVSQRTREMALLRSIGATRRQVLMAQLLEAVIVGVAASAVGLLAGVAVSGGLKGMMRAFGIDIPAGGTVFHLRTAVIAIVVGVLVTVCAAIFPSIRASRVRPLEALRRADAEAAGEGSTRWRVVRALLLMAVGIAGFVAGLSGQGVIWVGVGALAAFVAAFSLGPAIARPVARLLGFAPAHTVGVTGVLARENAVRSPGRTARTGGALMVGVALVAAVTIVAATARDWTHDAFEKQFSGDYVVSTKTFGFGGLDPRVAKQLDALPEVAAATGVRVGIAHDVKAGGDVGYAAVDPKTVGKVFDLGMVRGRIEDLRPDGILVDDGKARARHLHVGSTIRFRFLKGGVRTLTVQGIYREDDLAGSYVITHALHERTGVDQFDFSVYIASAPGVPPAQVEAAIERIVGHYPTADLQSRDEYVASQASQIDQIVNLMYGLLGLAVIIALLSIANSISLSIHERRRELGLLRAVGMTRHQTGSTVRWEAGIVATYGAAAGIGLGVFFGWAISVALRSDGLAAFVLPIPSLLLIVVGGIVCGTLAALRPAWRAAHLQVLEAIASG